jgi:hypothetical protein
LSEPAPAAQASDAGLGARRPGLWPAVLPLAALALLGFLAPLWADPHARQIAFLAAVALMILEFGLIGRGLARGWFGVIIDARKVMSLSRLQICGWTVTVLSALLVGAAFNIAGGQGVGVSLPTELLAAMGISAASLAATPALLSLKADRTPADPALQEQPRTGAVATNAALKDAELADVITGDEVGNAETADLGKIQQLLVTLLLLGLYGVTVWRAFAGQGFVASLPPLDRQFVWLLGVSHASYLAYKAAPHTATT